MAGSISQNDNDDVRIKGDDGTDEGAIPTVTKDGSKTKLDVEAVVSFGNMEDIIAMTRTSGFHDGREYDKLVYTQVSPNVKTVEYQFEGFCQFLITATLSGNDYTLERSFCEGFLLQENGDFLLQETGDKIKIQGLIPA